MDVGTTISHYRITAKICEGGMGEVYRARDTRLGRQVAMQPSDEWLIISASIGEEDLSQSLTVPFRNCRFLRSKAAELDRGSMEQWEEMLIIEHHSA